MPGCWFRVSEGSNNENRASRRERPAGRLHPDRHAGTRGPAAERPCARGLFRRACCGRPVHRQRPLGAGGRGLAGDAGLSAPPRRAGPGHSRGDGHGAARHGTGLGWRAGTDPAHAGGTAGRAGGEWLRDRSPGPGRGAPAGRCAAGLFRAARGDPEAGRADHPDGQPGAGAGGEDAGRLCQDLRRGAVGLRPSGDPALAGR